MAEPEMHHWIRFSFKRNDREFAEEAKRQLDRLTIEEGHFADRHGVMCPDGPGNAMSDIQFPIGVSLELIDKRRHDGHKAHADHLFRVAEGGRSCCMRRYRQSRRGRQRGVLRPGIRELGSAGRRRAG